MSRRILIAFAALCVWAWSPAVQAQDKPEIFPQLGHSLMVTSVAFSPDGKLLASGSWDKTAKLWDVASGRELRTLSGHVGFVTAVVFSPDGRGLASHSYDNTVKFWDVASGRELRSFSAGPLAFSPDGRMMALAGGNNAITLWDMASGRELRSLAGHSRNIAAIVFSPDGKLLASGSEDNTVKLWDVASGRELRTLSGHANYVTAVAFSPDGRMLASSSVDKTARLWDLASGRTLLILNAHTNVVSSVAFSPDGKLLASGSWDDTIKLWDVASGRALRSLTIPSVIVTSVAFSPNGKLLASGGGDNAVDLWDVASGRALRSLSGHSKTVPAVAFSPDGAVLASINSKTIEFWDRASGRELSTLGGHAGFVSSIAFSPDGKLLASGMTDGKGLAADGPGNTVELWDLASGRDLHTLAGHTKNVAAVAFSPDGKLLASGSWDKTIKLWDVASGRELRTLGGHSLYVSSVAFSPDGRMLASGSADKTIKLWDVASGRELRSLAGHANLVLSVAFSPDGRMLASGSGDNTIKLWDVAGGRELRSLSGHAWSINAVAFSPDGKILASGSWDHTIKLWDVASGRELRSLSGHSGFVNAVAFSPDGTVLASGGADGAVKLWDPSAGMERVSLTAFTDGSSLAITPAGYFDSSSAQAENNLNVRVGNRVFGIGSYRQKFYRPELVRLGLAGKPLEGFADLGSVKLAPVVELIGLPQTTSQPKLTVNLRLTDGGGGIGLVRLFLNGTAVFEDDTPAQGPGPITRSYTIPVIRGRNLIAAIAFNAAGTMQSNPASATVEADIPDPGTLHALVLGIQTFKNPKFNLGYSVADAQLFADTLRKYSKPLFDKLDIQLLITPEETDRDHVIAALKAMQAAAGPDDLFVFYVASHGDVANNNFYLATSNIDSFDADRLEAEALGGKALATLLVNIPAAKKLVIFDTCEAEAMADAMQLARLNGGMNSQTAATILSRSTGMAVFAAAKTNQAALEGYKDHGIFTYFLADGLAGKADLFKEGIVNTDGLTAYLRHEVPKLTNSLYYMKDGKKVFYDQHPIAEPSGEEFPVTKVK